MFAKIKSMTFFLGFLAGIGFAVASLSIPLMVSNSAQATTATLAAKLAGSAVGAGKCPSSCDLKAGGTSIVISYDKCRNEPCGVKKCTGGMPLKCTYSNNQK